MYLGYSHICGIRGCAALAGHFFTNELDNPYKHGSSFGLYALLVGIYPDNFEFSG